MRSPDPATHPSPVVRLSGWLSVEAVMMSYKHWRCLAGGWRAGGHDLVWRGAQVSHGAAASQVEWWVLGQYTMIRYHTDHEYLTLCCCLGVGLY